MLKNIIFTGLASAWKCHRKSLWLKNVGARVGLTDTGNRKKRRKKKILLPPQDPAQKKETKKVHEQTKRGGNKKCLV